eukprot:1805846-Pyramimonas_sp.AAC.1
MVREYRAGSLSDTVITIITVAVSIIITVIRPSQFRDVDSIRVPFGCGCEVKPGCTWAGSRVHCGGSQHPQGGDHELQHDDEQPHVCELLLLAWLHRPGMRLLRQRLGLCRLRHVRRR